MNHMSRDLLLILPQIMVLVTAVISLVSEMFRKPRISYWVVITGLLASGILSVTRMQWKATAFSETFRIDLLNHWSVVILGISGILLAMVMRRELKNTEREGTVYSLLAFSTLGSLILAGSGDLMFIVLGVLINGLSGFALAAYPKTDHATEGAMKYFIYGSVTGAVMLFGLTYWVGVTGSTLISSLGQAASQPVALIVGFAGLLAGLGYTASLFPFHFWTPDTFEASPVSVAAYLSVTPKIGAVFALAQVVKDLPQGFIDWNLILAILAVSSMTYGNIVALWQKNTVRLLAYSTIAQAGYFLLGIIAIGLSDMAYPSLIIFGLAYIAMNIGIFATVQYTGPEIEDVDGLALAKPFLASAMTVFLLSLVGIPPLAGFAGKLLLFSAAMDSGYSWLAVIAIINSVISLAVYLKIIVPIFFRGRSRTFSPLPVLTLLVVLISFGITVLAGIGVQWLL